MEADKPVLSRREKAELKLRQAQERVKKIAAVERKATRNIETRRKVILGAWVAKSIPKTTGLAAVVLGWINQMPPKDRALFSDPEMLEKLRAKAELDRAPRKN